ncbi:phosphatidylglycerophosphatase A [Gottschalkia purinilytica]|uniref:Phosphatidylglycerophosphatase A n=1 Tax=Gottschalkia purinilytica TaxID=1503 RepID=A0A0L0WD30_GOTPU|nr:phosphatidylglycerophosphatase A [Gottschalkia purinilytica]KNF09378.1 phosphatidylglycerophosphatase A [Gottschalkia purinilytica]
MKDIVIKKMEQRGATVEDIAKIVYDLQKNYVNITLEYCIKNVERILEKREVQNAVLTGIQIDELAEKDLLDEPLLSIVKQDESLYGIDEILALSITNIYGSIGFTNFGYLDKVKVGIIGELDRLGKSSDKVHTFLDDLICGIVAAACAKIAHAASDN